MALIRTTRHTYFRLPLDPRNFSDLATLPTKSALYTKCTGHLELSMAFNAVAAGCTNRRFKEGDLVIVLQELPGIESTMVGALAIATGKLATQKWSDIWVNWIPNNPDKVCVNEVKFITRPVAITKATYGKLTQTDISLSSRPGVISHLLTNGTA